MGLLLLLLTRGFVGFVMPDRTASCCSKHSMMTGKVPGSTADSCAFETSLRISAGDCQRHTCRGYQDHH